jgi:hypothetical protein
MVRGFLFAHTRMVRLAVTTKRSTYLFCLGHVEDLEHSGAGSKPNGAAPVNFSADEPWF